MTSIIRYVKSLEERQTRARRLQAQATVARTGGGAEGEAPTVAAAAVTSRGALPPPPPAHPPAHPPAPGAEALATPSSLQVQYDMQPLPLQQHRTPMAFASPAVVSAR
jgi:hypothetical protein